MASVYRLGEQIQKIFGQKVVGSKITRQEAMLAASQAANKLARDLIWRNKAEGIETIPYSYLKEYRLGIQKDTIRGTWYATLPVRTLESVANNRGIYHVAPASDIDEAMVPTDAGFGHMFRGMESYQLEGKLYYTPERDRIYIKGAEFEADYEIFVRLIPDATMLDADDELPLPPEAETDAILMALQILGVQMQSPKDVTTDNI